MKKLIITITLLIMAASPAFSSGMYIGVAPNGNVYGSIRVHSGDHVRHFHRRACNTSRIRPVIYRRVPWQVYPDPPPKRTIIEKRIVYVQSAPNYIPGQTATVVDQNGSKEIIYVTPASLASHQETLREKQDRELAEMNALLHEAKMARLELKLKRELEKLSNERTSNSGGN